MTKSSYDVISVLSCFVFPARKIRFSCVSFRFRRSPVQPVLPATRPRISPSGCYVFRCVGLLLIDRKHRLALCEPQQEREGNDERSECVPAFQGGEVSGPKCVCACV